VLRLAIGLVAAVLAGSAAPPKTALLTHVKAEASRVTFSFRSAPLRITGGWVPGSKVSEDGSGKHVQVAGAAVLVLRFVPASGADLSGNTFRLVYKGPRRLKPPAGGPVREVVRVGDFEAMLSWAIGLDRKRPYRIVRNGANVVVTFG
jgi:hypothetical protein